MIFNTRGGNPGSRVTLSERQIGEGIIELDIRYELAQKAVPEEFVVTTSIPSREVYSVWSPSMWAERTIGKNYDWKRTSSRIASGAPVHCLVSRAGKNVMCLSLSDAATATQIRSGIAEEDAEIKWEISFFTAPSTPITEYNVTVRIDTRDIQFYDSIYDVVDWWENECGYIPAPVPDAARLPMNSLWYSFHQELEPDKIIEQCELSGPLGMKSVIIDDGWQTNDSNRGYAFCGDWEPVRMPDMKGLSDAIHALGMKVIIWFAVPFIGKKAKRYAEFEEFILDRESTNDVSVLDPRYKHIREYLVKTYADAVKNWGLDGLKLDFIDNFYLTPTSLLPDPRRDIESLEEAVDALMTDVTAALREINPDILIEFRQTYIGPSIRKYGNMLRVMDCPGDGLFNRRGAVDLRLTSGRTAVHSDMLMWNLGDTKESVACQLASVLYCVPQISMLIDRLPREHYDTLKYYLSFWREHRDILLDGRLTLDAPESFYSQIRACKDGEAVITVYENAVVEGEYIKLTVVCVNPLGYVYLKGMQGKSYTVVDCMGTQQSCGVIEESLAQVSAPLGGMIFIK